MNKIIIGIIIASIFGFMIYQSSKIENLSNKLGQVVAENESIKNKFLSIDNDIKSFKEDKRMLDEKIKLIETDNRTTKAKLDENKKRSDVLISKPSLTERMINKSFKQATDNLSCTTGATERCVQ